MADKILQTRIINKHADLAAWKESTLPLKTGEIALARVETSKPDGHGGFYSVPTYLMKVGDGEKTFSQLEWLAAPASDVYEWAKAATKPGYNATEIVRGTSNVASDLTSAEERINILETAVGSNGSVANAIKAAIEALDENTWAAEDGIKFVTAVGETDGKISVVRRALTADDIPTLEIAKINGLQAALNLKATKSELEEAINGVNNTINGTVAENIADALEAGQNAQTTIDNYKIANDAALAEVKATAEAATTVSEAEGIANAAVATFKGTYFDGVAERVGIAETDIDTLERNLANLAGEGRTTETVKGNAAAIADLEQRIGSVANVMNFRGVSVKGDNTTPGHDITDPQNGDVIIYGDAEYVYNVIEGSGAWVKFGDASDNAAAISGLQTRVGTIESRLNSGDIHEGINAAQAQADKGVADAKSALEHSQGVAKDLADEIARATKAETDNLATAKSYAEEKATAAQNAANGYTDNKIAGVNESITALSNTVSQNKTDATNAIGQVASDLADYEESNDAALDVVRTNAQKGVDDAAAALLYAKTLETSKVDVNTEAIGGNSNKIAVIERDYARVKDNKLVYGQGDAEMTIIFDCGGAE